MSQRPFSVVESFGHSSSAKTLVAAVTKLEEQGDYLDEFLKRMGNLAVAGTDGAIDAFLELSVEIRTNKRLSIFQLSEDVEKCRWAAIDFGRKEQLEELALPCRKCGSWLKEELWPQVAEFARDLSECVEGIRARKQESSEGSQRGTSKQGPSKEHDRLQKLLSENRYDPKGSEVFNSCAYQKGFMSDEEYLLYDLFNRMARVAGQLRTIRQYLMSMAGCISKRFYPPDV